MAFSHRSGVERRKRELERRVLQAERARLLDGLRSRVDPSLLADA